MDDLARWDASLYTGRLVRSETLQRAFTPRSLPSGKPTDYGYGWQSGQWEGFTVVQHGGGINGFLSMGVRVPEKRVYVAILSNRTAEPLPFPVAQRIATYLIGKPWDPRRIEIAPDVLERYVGVYAADPPETLTLSLDKGRLQTAGPRGPRGEANFVSESEFFYPGEMDRLRFERDAQGRVTALVREGFGTAPVRMTRAAQAPKPATPANDR